MRKYFFIIFIFTTVLIFFLNPIVFAINSVYVWSPTNDTIQTSSDIVNSGIPTSGTTNLQLESGAGILIEQSTGQILYEHNSHEQLRPASVTKVMTILLIMEALENGTITLEDTVPCSANARSMGGSQIWLDEREQLTVHEMLKAICVVSANDCTVAMAEYLHGSQEAFVQKMNERAKQLGMNDTCFKNCHGIDEDGHVTSAYDIAIMSRELLLNHPDITNYTTIWLDSLRDGKSQLVNTNKLLRNYSGCTGLKTGSTSLALYNLSASATRDDLSLIAVILKAPTTEIRFNEAKKLLDYGFSNFAYTSFATAGETLKTVSIDKGIISNINAVFSKDAGAITLKNQNSNITQKITLPDRLIAPVYAGQKIGEVSYFLDGTQLCTVDIVAQSDAPKISFINMSSHLYKSWFCLMRK